MWAGELSRVMICGSDSQDHTIVAADRTSVDIYIRRCSPVKDAGNSSMAQQFLHRGLCQIWILMQLCPLMRVLQQRQPCICQETGQRVCEADESGVAECLRPGVKMLFQFCICRFCRDFQACIIGL